MHVNAGFGKLCCVIIIVIGNSLQRSALVICTEFEYMIMCPTIFILVTPPLSQLKVTFPIYRTAPTCCVDVFSGEPIQDV